MHKETNVVKWDLVVYLTYNFPEVHHAAKRRVQAYHCMPGYVISRMTMLTLLVSFEIYLFISMKLPKK